MQLLLHLLRWVHISAGGVALFTLWVPLVVLKGGPLHRRVGSVYLWAMFVAAVTAIAIAPLRMLERPVERWGGPVFLAYVAFLSFASAFYGRRALGRKGRTGPSRSAIDLAFPAVLLLLTVGLVVGGLVSGFRLALYFSPVGFLVSVPELRSLLRTPADGRAWLREHLSGMLVSGIATLTAFAVVNAGFAGYGIFSVAAWLAPTAVGVPFLIYWQRFYGSGRGRLVESAPAT